MKKLTIIIALVLLLSDVFSQNKPMRLEFEISSVQDDYYVIPLAKEGLLLFYEGETQKGGTRLWTFAKYDTDFEEDWSKTEDLRYSMEFVNPVEIEWEVRVG